jgi:sortase (surface protein transpeptidase)
MINGGRRRGCRSAAATALIGVLSATALGCGPSTTASSAEQTTSIAEPVVVVDRPVQLLIPALELDAPVIPLELEETGELEVPEDPDNTGWFTGGPEPGEPGAAVIAGHVDSKTGPAVFHGLRDLSPGDEITVVGAGGESATFSVDRLEQHDKAQFPTVDVYGPTDSPELRLITCSGGFDRASGHYKDNLVVFASLVQAG